MSEFKILFVDDEENILKAFERTFLEDTMKIYTAESAKRALELISLTDLDLIVTDIKMPGMHGLELIEEIRKKNSVVPVMVYTAFSGMKEDFVLHTHGIVDYYTKPDDYDSLCKRIKDMAVEKLFRGKTSI